jgi:hypothetical protein
LPLRQSVPLQLPFFPPVHEEAEQEGRSHGDKNEHAHHQEVAHGCRCMSRGHDDAERPADREQPAEHGFGEGIGVFGDQIPGTQSAKPENNSKNCHEQIVFHDSLFLCLNYTPTSLFCQYFLEFVKSGSTGSTSSLKSSSP